MRGILQTYSWHLKLRDKTPESVTQRMRTLGAVLVRTQPVLRGLRLSEADDNRLHIQLRVAGHSRWEIQANARKLIIKFLRSVYSMPSDLELELVTTERNGRELYAGEGRTPMTKPPRAATKPDGRPWDHYEWWGDDLPTNPVDPSATEDPNVSEVAPWFQ